MLIEPLNTTTRETPSDLAKVPFDSPQMKTRFRALLDVLMPLFTEHVKYLSIGNEVDVYLSGHPDEWAAYQSFYEDAVAYVHSAAPWIKVGVTTTFTGANSDSAGEVARLTTASDIVILAYYPLSDNYTVRSPDAPLTDIPRMIELAKGRPLILLEVGYPTSARLNSSEEAQARFAANVFTAWQAAGDRIPFLSFFALHDFSPQICEALAKYYGLPDDENFKAYLCSLGLRRANGTPKLAWQSLVDSAAATGFP